MKNIIIAIISSLLLFAVLKSNNLRLDNQEYRDSIASLDARISNYDAEIKEQNELISWVEEYNNALMDSISRLNEEKNRLIAKRNEDLDKVEKYNSSQTRQYFSERYDPGDSISVIKDLITGEKCCEIEKIQKREIVYLETVISNKDSIISAQNNVILLADSVRTAISSKYLLCESELEEQAKVNKALRRKNGFLKGSTAAFGVVALILLLK